MKIKYPHLLNTKFTKRISKSIYPHIYLHFLEYENPLEIPFEEIARLTNEDPHAVRSCLRPATTNESIADALIELGVEAEDLPSWFKLSNSAKRMRAKANKQRDVKPTRSEQDLEKKVARPARGRIVLFPSNGISPSTPFRNFQAPEAEAITSTDDFYEERLLSPVEEAYWRARLEALREHDLREQKQREEIRRIEDRAKKPLTLDEFKTLSEMRKLYRNVEVQGLWDEYNYGKSVAVFKAANDRAAFEKDRDEALQLAGETMGKVTATFNEMRPTGVPENIIPLRPPNREDQHKKLRILTRQKEEEKTKGLMAIAEFTRDQRKKNRATKMYRHGSLLRPQKVYYPTGHNPVKLLGGEKGERITSLLNLDHLRENE